MNSYRPEDMIIIFNGEEVKNLPKDVAEIKEVWKGKVELAEEGKSKLLPYMENFNKEEVTFTIDDIEYVCKGFDENGDILFEEKE